jgi:hypothetical protein
VSASDRNQEDLWLCVQSLEDVLDLENIRSHLPFVRRLPIGEEDARSDLLQSRYTALFSSISLDIGVRSEHCLLRHPNPVQY